MALMDHPVWWDEETAAAYRMENSHTTRITLIISYAVKQYLKLDKLHILRKLPTSSKWCTGCFASGCESVHPDVSTFPPFLGLSFDETDWMSKWRKNVIVRHNSQGPQPHRPKQDCNKSKYYKLTILNIRELIHSHTFHMGYLRQEHTQCRRWRVPTSGLLRWPVDLLQLLHRSILPNIEFNMYITNYV
jgi:hypothetical protein